ncbi:MAG: glucosaminidase [Candidatus Pelagibacter sp.]|nr:glucosaminidase [Candidatus Pelagibacter sp.]|tara:strand:- start:1095 stop:2204 length:1110 start_codon:yes stop_codon:yes gene_type:complete
MNIEEIKKILLKKGFKISRLRRNKNYAKYRSVYISAFVSLFLIGTFAILPSIFNIFSDTFKKNNVVENYSKKYLEKVLSGEKLVIDKSIDDALDERHLFEDVEFKSGPSQSVRIEASILKQIFEENNYKLKNVRDNKLVKPFEVGMLPGELKLIESSKLRKELFIEIVLPLVLSENNRIIRDRSTLFKILNKNNNTKSEKEWLLKKFKQYGVVKRDLSTLKIRMDIIPVSLAIAQAAKETGWGTSRFAIEGNALFGQWTYNGEGIRPAAADKNDKHKIATFSVLKASVRAYQRNLNTHSSYKEFRKARATQRDNNENLNSLELADYLKDYAETGEEYTKILKKIINQNNLTDFDNAKILPINKETKNNI